MRCALQVALVTSTLGLLLGGSARAQAAHEGVVTITAADSAAGSHRDFDVEVWRMTAPERGVMFVLYRTENGAVRSFTPFAAIDSTASVTAAYAWVDDSTVVIRLRDAAGSTLKSYRITGYRSTARMERLP